jgi:hypothetical protein
MRAAHPARFRISANLQHVLRSESPCACRAKADYLHALTPLLHIRFAGLQKVLVISKLRM